MKRILGIFSLVTTLMLSYSVSASAQYFDHLGLGITLGTDGVGLELAAPLGSQFQIRAGYSLFPPVYKPHKMIEVDLSDGSGKQPVDIEGIIKAGAANLMVDWHPGGGGFFLTAGLYAGSRKIFEARNKDPFLAEEDWGKAGIRVGDYVIRTDEKGIARASLVYLPVRPYLGLGFGNAINAYQRVGFNVELGACYAGSFRVRGYGYNTSTFEDGTVYVTSADIDNQDKGIIDILGKFPVLPVFKFGVFVRLF